MEDDDVSVTSTAVEEYSESEEFEVERILAEKMVEGESLYLLSWMGYPEEKHTWEPKEHIQNAEILQDWDDRKQLESQGFEYPFDLQRWDALMQKIAEEKECRQRLRLAKRKRLGIHVPAASSDDEFIVPMEVDEVIEFDAGTKNNRKSSFKKSNIFGQTSARRGIYQSDDASSDEDTPMVLQDLENVTAEAKKIRKPKQESASTYTGTAAPETARPPKELKRARTRSTSSSDNPLANKRPQNSQVRSQVPVQPKAGKPFVIPKRSAQPKPSAITGQQSVQNMTDRSGRGQTATRGGKSLGSRSRPRNLLSTSANPGAQPKAFKNKRTERLAEVRARGLGDRAPDIEVLGGLFNPSNPAEFRLTNSEIRKIRAVGDPDDIFVDQGAPDRPKKPAVEAFISPPYLPISQPPPPNPHEAVCYYYDRFQKDPTKGECSKGSMCPFIHSYPPGVPVAAAPAPQTFGKKGQRFTCYYWDSNVRVSGVGSCTNGSSCPFLHEYVEGVLIAPKPGSSKRDGYAFRDDAPLAPAPTPRSKDKICSYWEKNSCWNSAETCDFRHYYSKDDFPVAPNKSSTVKVAPAVSCMSIEEYLRTNTGWKAHQVCKFWQQGYCSKASVDCEYFHDYAQNIPPVPPPEFRIVNGRRQLLQPCKYWLRNNCSRSKDICDRIHYIPLSAESPAREPPVVRPEREPAPSMSRPGSRRTVSFGDKPMRFYDEPRVIYDEPDMMSPADETHDQVHQPVRPPEFGHQARKSVSFSEARVYPSSEAGAIHVTQGEGRDQPSTLPSAKQTSFDVQSNAFPDPMAALKPVTKLSLDYYRRLTVSNHLADGTKEVSFGSSQAVVVDFRALLQLEQPWAQELATLPKIKFGQVCMAHDLEPLFTDQQIPILWSSSLVLANPSDSASSTIDLMASEMRLRSSGLTFAFSNFVMFVHPKTPEWRFLRIQNENNQDAKLNLVVFEGSFDTRKSKKLTTLLSPGDFPGPAQAAPHRKTLVKQVHNLEFKRLLPTLGDKSPHKPYNVFLVFPANDTRDFLISWLHASCLPELNLKVYSSQEEGAWDFFAKTVNAGVILIHESMVVEICGLPHFREVVQKTTAFWYISDSSTPYPMYPSHHTGEDKQRILGQITATLLLPHGQAFLITPSMVVAEPERTLEIIEWFFDQKLNSATAGTWKLVVCHGFADYVHDIAISKVNEKQEFEEKNRHNPSLDQMLLDKGLDFVKCKTRYALHAKLVEYQTKGVIKSSLSGANMEEQYSPIIYAPPMINPDNEKLLVEWFASWSLQKLDKHRRFTVIGTGPGSEPRAFRSVGAQVGKVAEKDIVFEPTSVWYSRAREAGNGYEHVLVDSWEVTYPNIRGVQVRGGKPMAKK